MKLKSLILGIAIVFSSLFFTISNVQAYGLELAGPTDVGMLYVDTSQTNTVQKNGAYYLVVSAEEKYTDQKFLAELHKEKTLKNVIGAVYLYLFDNKGSSYCVVGNYLVDGQGKVCVDYGSDMKMKKLTAKDKTMLNAYTLCLKALENKNRFQKKF